MFSKRNFPLFDEIEKRTNFNPVISAKMTNKNVIDIIAKRLENGDREFENKLCISLFNKGL